MKTSLSILARNIHAAAQMLTEAILRRAVLRPMVNVRANHRRFVYSRYLRSNRGYLRHKL